MTTQHRHDERRAGAFRSDHDYRAFLKSYRHLSALGCFLGDVAEEKQRLLLLGDLEFAQPLEKIEEYLRRGFLEAGEPDLLQHRFPVFA